MKESGDITRCLEAWRRGEEGSSDVLMERIYAELRGLATSYLRRERRDHTLETSALVHEAYLRLADQKRMAWQDRAHFLAMAAQMMRRVLANHARDRSCAKRGQGARHLSLDEQQAATENAFAEALAIHDALDHLAERDPQQASVVQLRYFGGLTNDEISEVLGISPPTVQRRWRVARAWLYRHLDTGSPM